MAGQRADDVFDHLQSSTTSLRRELATSETGLDVSQGKRTAVVEGSYSSALPARSSSVTNLHCSLHSTPRWTPVALFLSSSSRTSTSKGNRVASKLPPTGGCGGDKLIRHEAQ
eukprot:CAMPEP_0182478970 /NCGR_PEP_ID=MMETSP1319-20130603/33352_1 /TAXON_ID=172717 /ORGANISM="Bolidomonas pacifica, Strain RCC208" /LENGTH=112 /DNA_ID=CAMNT_0024680355 /DNA_START=67 /DNA_END=405 /DNA_ORIENTATION=+